MAKALVFGATGFVGASLLELLLRETKYTKVLAVTRKPLLITDRKLENLLGDFSSITNLSERLVADDVFISLGTTKAKTPDLREYYQIDHDYPVLAAKLALEKGARSVSIVSAVGADEKSTVFYVRTKGETDRDIKNLGYARTNIFQPSIIMGERPEKRLLESAAISLFSVVNSAMIGRLSRYRGIDARAIAKAMVLAPKSGGERTVVYQWRDMMDLNSETE